MKGRSGVGNFFLYAGIALTVIGGIAAVGGYAAGGAMGGMAGGIVASIGIIWAIVGFGVTAMYRNWARKAAADRQLFETGQRATGVIENVETTGLTVNEVNSQIRLTVRVEPRGEPEFTVTEKMLVPFNAMPRPGDLIEVGYDPAQPGRVAFETDWRIDTAGGRALITRRPADAQPSPAPAAPDGGEDVLDRLEQLQRLREAGTLSDAEFQAQKARILASSQ